MGNYPIAKLGGLVRFFPVGLLLPRAVMVCPFLYPFPSTLVFSYLGKTTI
jgi:hypothetical protein